MNQSNLFPFSWTLKGERFSCCRLSITFKCDPVSVSIFFRLKTGCHLSYQTGKKKKKCCLHSGLNLNINNLDRVEDWPQGSSLNPQPDMKSILFIHSVSSIHISWSIGNKCSIHAVTRSNKVVELLHDEPTQTTGDFRHYMNYIHNRELQHEIRNKPVCWGDST